MTALLSQADWERYKKVINDAGDTFNKIPIVWRRKTIHMDRFGEDPSGNGSTYTDINLEALILSNYFRSWPINESKVQGELDEENLTIILNYQYLRDLGYLTTNEYFAFDAALDLFLIKGRAYKAFGDIDVSYANNEPLMFWITCSREIIPTGKVTNP